MLVNQIVYDAVTKETRIEEVEVNDEIQELPIIPLTTEERVDKLETTDIDLLATNWSIDNRVLEVEWLLDSLATPNTYKLKSIKKDIGLSRFEQAKILISAGRYERELMEKQLIKYESKGLISKEELDILISMMDEQELVQ